MTEFAISLLFVEDNALVARSLQRLLQRCGIHVTLVTSAKAALEVLATRSFDALLSDIHMPGMTGLELCNHISPDMLARTILYTGVSEGIVPPAGVPLLEKPVEFSKLREAVLRVARQPSPSC